MSGNVRGRVGLALWRPLIGLPFGRPAQTPPSVVRDAFGMRSGHESISIFWPSRRAFAAPVPASCARPPSVARALPPDTALLRSRFDSFRTRRWHISRQLQERHSAGRHNILGWRSGIHTTARRRGNAETPSDESPASTGAKSQGPLAEPTPQVPQAQLSPHPRPRSDASRDEPAPSAAHGKPLRDRLPHLTPHLHRPTKEELLAAATGFWSRLRVRFKWFSIKSARPFNMDDISAFFSWIVIGHIVWIVIGTTTFFSLAIFMANTVFAQGTPTQLSAP